MLNTIGTIMLWNFPFAYLSIAAFIISIVSLMNCGCKKKQHKREHKAESPSSDDKKKGKGKNISKADKQKVKKEIKMSKKEAQKIDSEVATERKGETKNEGKAESEAKTEDVERTDIQKEKALADMPESIDVIDEPRKFLPETPEEQEAYRNIIQGKMRAAKDNETVEDAVSDWGQVQKVEGMPKKERTRKKERYSDEEN